MTLDARLFGDWVAGYHLTNIVLHALTTVLVFGLVRQLLLASGNPMTLSTNVALLAALVFGVHPLHTEVVNSIFNRSEILASLGVSGGLWWFLHSHEAHPKKSWFGLTLIYMGVLFCRENAISLPALAVAMLWLTSSENGWLRWRKCIPVLLLLIPLGIYLGLRANALTLPSAIEETIAPVATQAIATQAEATQAAATQASQVAEKPLGFDARRLRPAIKLWFKAMKLMVWPHPLQVFPQIAVVNTWIALASQLVLLGGAVVGYRYQRRGLIIGLAFFYIALLPSSRLIAESGALVFLSERSLYMPSIGFAVILAFGLVHLVQRFNLRVAMVSVGALIVVLTPLTWARNADWDSNKTLLESDYEHGARGTAILAALVDAHLEEQDISRAIEICDLETGKWQEGKSTRRGLSFKCGSAYSRAGRFTTAEQAYLAALRPSKESATIHFNLAILYLRMNRESDAKNQFELAVAAERLPHMKEFTSAQMLLELYPHDRARLLQAKSHLEMAMELQPQFYQARQLLDQLNEFLSADL